MGDTGEYDGGEQAACPRGWEVRYSESKEPGRPYYVRLRDGHRQWEPPTNYNWELVVAVVVLMGVAFYPGPERPAAGLSVPTDGGCICAPYSYDGDQQVGAGCVVDDGYTGWCEVEPGCKGARDGTAEYAGWDTCTVVGAGGANPSSADTDGGASGGSSQYVSPQAHSDGGDVTSAASAGGQQQSDPGSEQPSAGSGQQPAAAVPHLRCSDQTPCPEEYACTLDEALDFSVCVRNDGTEDDGGWLTVFQPKLGTPVQLRRLDEDVSDATLQATSQDGVHVAGIHQGTSQPRTTAGKLPRGPSQPGIANAQREKERRAREAEAARAREQLVQAQRELVLALQAAEVAAQAKFEDTLSLMGWCAMWLGALLAGLYVFESFPMLHNGAFAAVVWLLFLGRTLFAVLPSFVAAMVWRDTTKRTVQAENSCASHAVLVSVVVLPPPPGVCASWHTTWCHLQEQTRQHDCTEVIFVGEPSVIPPLPLKSLAVQFIATPSSDPAAMRKVGAAAARGSALLFITCDVILPARYDEQIVEILSDSYAFAGTFDFGLYSAALRSRIEKQADVITRQEQRLARALNSGDSTIGHIESGLMLDESDFRRLISEPGHQSHLPIGSAAMQTCARLWAYLQQPRVERCFFLRASDFGSVADVPRALAQQLRQHAWSRGARLCIASSTAWSIAIAPAANWRC